MKRFTLSIGLCAVLATAVPAQTTKYGVTATVDKPASFATFKSYAWTAGQPSADKQIDARIVAAVDKELAALGMAKATSGRPDVLVTYSSLSRTDVNLKAKPNAEGKRPAYWVGTLVVALLDQGSRERLLRLRIDQPIEIEREQLGPTIDSAVTALFAKYPTRARN